MGALKLTLLGSLHITRADGTAVVRARKELALLAYLAVEGEQTHSRDTLIGMFWPESPEAAARNSLRVALANLRAALGEATEPYLLASRHNVQFNTTSDHTLDVTAFEALVAEYRAHRHPIGALCTACVARLHEAVALYRGDFLSGFLLPDSAPFEEWALVQRERLHQHALEALAMLAAYHDQQGDYAALAHNARRQIELEPWRERAYRQLMQALSALGDRAAALAAYARCRQVLKAELDVEPDAETRALGERINAGTLRAPAPMFSPPAPLTPFVGRERELAEITARVRQADVRLLTLTGAGGMGKTRLALEIARLQLADSAADPPELVAESTRLAFPDGVFFVSLAPLSSPAAIVPAIAAALGLSLHGDPQQALLHVLHDKRLLLILDNFEHLVAGVELILAILQSAPRVQLIATSRERLNVRGEHVYVVEGMDYRAEDRATSAAIRLFVQSARRVRADFAPNEAQLPLLLRICDLVRGMPLGIELAAAWVDMLPLVTIAAEIERSADFLAFDWRDAPERQRSMRAVFDWSWNLLNDAERQALRALTVFRRGCTFEAAQAVVNASLRVLTSLVHKSLLRWSGAHDGVGRYEIHELLRQFAAEQLDAVPTERAAVETRHGTYYLAFVAARARRLGRDQPREAVAEIQEEIDNIRQAWNWAVAEARATELAQAAYGWWQFCLLTGQDPESRHTFGLAVARLHSMGDLASADALSRQQHQRGLSILLAIHANHLFSNAPYEEMAAEAREAIRLGGESGGMEGETLGHFVLGRALQELGRMREAAAMWERTIQLAHAYQPLEPSSELLHEAEWMAYIWLFGAMLFFEDYAGGRAYAVAALNISQSRHKRRAELLSMASLAMIDFYMGDDLSARQRYEQVLPLARVLNDRWAEMRVQRDLSEVLRVQGEYAQAVNVLGTVVATAQKIGVVYEEILALAALVRLHCQLGDMRGAANWREQVVQRMRGTGVTRDCQAEGLRACAVYALHSGNHHQALADAQAAWEISQQIDVPTFRADSAVILGHALFGMQQPEAARAAYQQAVDLCITTGNVAMAIEPQAGLVQLALAQGDHAGAQTLVETMLPVLAERPRARVLTPFYAYLICYRVLEANNDPRAASLLQRAAHHLRACAAHITDDALRQSFLEHVAAHHAIITLARTTATPAAGR